MYIFGNNNAVTNLGISVEFQCLGEATKDKRAIFMHWFIVKCIGTNGAKYNHAFFQHILKFC